MNPKLRIAELKLTEVREKLTHLQSLLNRLESAEPGTYSSITLESARFDVDEQKIAAEIAEQELLEAQQGVTTK